MPIATDDIQALKRGWKVGFGDDDEFVDYFFANYDDETTRRVMRNAEGEIVAQMHCFVFDDEVCGAKGCYVYGVTTLPEWRGTGLARQMITEALAAMRADGVGYAVLIAQEEGLRKWYETLGFVSINLTIDVRGADDDMNFGMDDASLNQGLYHILNEDIKEFTHEVRVNKIMQTQ